MAGPPDFARPPDTARPHTTGEERQPSRLRDQYSGAVPWTDEVIKTERLRLRAWSDGDNWVLKELLTSPDVRRYLGGPVDKEVVQTILDKAVGKRPNVFCIADLLTDTAYGSVSLDLELHGEPEVSYDLIASAWRRGFAREAMTAFLSWVWRETDSSSIIAVTQPANVPYCRLLDRLDFQFEREFVEFGEPQSQYRCKRPKADT
jgi:RimJ/RimL family protein N-acetyltransferase